MRKIILIVLLAAVAAVAQQGGGAKQAAKSQVPASKAKILTRAELDTFLASPDKVLLIDVRRPDEVQSIGGFPVYLSVQLADLEKHFAEIPRDRTIITVSNHAVRAGRAADLLESKGFKVAGAVGAQTYESEGGKLFKVEVPKPSAVAEKK